MPPGLTLPNSTSATPLPASTPPNQASRIAGAAASTLLSVSGRELNSTTANGLLVLLTASMMACCWPGRSRFERDLGLAAHLARLADRDDDLVGRLRRRDHGRGVDRRALVRRVVEVVVADRAARRERRVRVLLLDTGEAARRRRCRRRAPTTGRACRARCRRSGPITATDFAGEIGSTGPLFLSRTTERPAATRAAARFSGSSCFFCASATLMYGCSKSPARNLIRRIRRTASSMRFIETARLCTSWAPKSR